MTNLEFVDEKNTEPYKVSLVSSPKVPGMISFLIKKGFISTVRQGRFILVTVACVGICLSLFISFLTFRPEPSPTPEQREAVDELMRRVPETIPQ